MRYYQQSDLFQVLLSAALDEKLRPNTALLKLYKQKRYNAAERALRARNIFLFTEGTRSVVTLNSVAPTIYTQPAGERMIVIGYSDNLRYGATEQNDILSIPPSSLTALFPQMHRLRIVGHNERAICEDLTPAQAGVSGQPRYTSTHFTVPTIIEPDEQIAIDLGYDTAAGLEPTFVYPNGFIIFCLKVKDKFTPEDDNVLADVRTYIAANDFQRGLYLNALDVNSQGPIAYNAVGAGATAVAETRPVTHPVLITGVGTNLGASTIKITDIADGSSFSLDRPMTVSALNMPNYEEIGNTSNAPAGAPDWTNFFQLPFPHLLRSGAQLRVDLVNGRTDFTATVVTDPQQGDVLGRPGPVVMFQGINV